MQVSHVKSNEVLLQVQGLKKHFGKLKVLDGIDIDIHKGEVVAVIGPSGSGKSTFIRCLNRLEEPTDGKVIFEGKQINTKHANIDQIRQKIGMVFQNFNLFRNMTILQNITASPINVKHIPKEQAEANALRLLERVGLKDKAQEYPVRLSGGQQQRVAIARALMMEPQVLLFDEPTAALDPEITAQIVSIIRELAETNITQVIVTHEVEVARKTASRVVYMENGHIVEQGDASCFTEPQTEAFKNYLSH